MVENVSYSLSDRAPILEQINEHYGTSFTNWSDNEIGLSIGDTVPSWAEYEKIAEETLRFKNIGTGNNGPIAKYSTNQKKLLLAANNNGYLYIVNNNGKVITDGGPAVNVLAPQFKADVENAGFKVESTGSWLIDLQIGSQVENWEQYIGV